MKQVAFALLALLAMPAVAAAEPNKAFAAVAAPEQSFDTCHAADTQAAIDCAMKKCVGAGGNECAIVAACADGWAGFMGVTTGEIEFTDAVCGAPDKASVISALTAFCKGSKKFAIQCSISAVFDPQGRETSINKSLNPKTLK
jgi:hypothetical protein